MKKNNKIIVILGPTSCGKTRLAVQLADEFNGEIVSADSRQVYRGLDIGTGKDLKEYRLKIPNPKSQIPKKIQVPYHLIDVVSPKQQFDLARYQKLAFKAIDDIIKRGKLPILVGGSGLYLQAVVDNYKLSRVKKNQKLRAKLEAMTAEQLFNELKKISRETALGLNQGERHNRRHLARYVEIFKTDKSFKNKIGEKKYQSLLIGLNPGREVLKKKIAERLTKRLNEEQMIGEVETLKKRGLSWRRLDDFGLEYRFIARYLRQEFGYDDLIKLLAIAINQFSRRQISWFKRWERQGAKIYWLSDINKIKGLIKNFIK